jgi:hypothetical protein
MINLENAIIVWGDLRSVAWICHCVRPIRGQGCASLMSHHHWRGMMSVEEFGGSRSQSGGEDQDRQLGIPNRRSCSTVHTVLYHKPERME